MAREPPAWLGVYELASNTDSNLDHLDEGEKEAICLAEEINADLLILDDSDARITAARRKLPFMGTLGVLRRAARLDIIDLPHTLARLQATTFCVDPKLIQSLLDEDEQRRSG